MTLPAKFWEEWYESVDRCKVIRKLAFKEYLNKINTKDAGEKAMIEYTFYMLLNSYFEDFMEWVNDKNG